MFKLKLGDSAEVLKSCPSDYIDLVVTSPPYDNLRTYNGFTFNFEVIAKELSRTLKPGGVIVWIVNDATMKGSETGTSFGQALYFKAVCGLNLHDTMIYEKLNPVPNKQNRYQSCFEYMFILSKGVPKSFNPLLEDCKLAGRGNSTPSQYKTSSTVKFNTSNTIRDVKIKKNIWGYFVGNINSDAKWRHPAKFPLQLAVDHIQSWSNPGDVVLDPFLGSGTTGVAALQLGRKFIGIEISDEYLQTAKQRIEEATNGTK
jgi:site-specific DNA-methyltransferase (adenine-specific)